MNQPKKPLELPIVSGPSKFDFLQSLSFRKRSTQMVTFKLGINGWPVDVEVEIVAIMKDDGVDVDGDDENHSWRFYTSVPFPKTGGCHKEELKFNLVGSYSTKTRRGWVRPIGHYRSVLVYAAFEQDISLRDLQDEGFNLPPNDEKS